MLDILYQEGHIMEPYHIKSKKITIVKLLVLATIMTGCFTTPEFSDTPQSPSNGVAFIITSDFTEASYSTIDIETLKPYRDLGLQMIHPDSFARYSALHNRVYIINRIGRDNIQVLEPLDNFQTKMETSTGPGSNPHDIVFISSAKALTNTTPALLLVMTLRPSPSPIIVCRVS